MYIIHVMFCVPASFLSRALFRFLVGGEVLCSDQSFCRTVGASLTGFGGGVSRSPSDSSPSPPSLLESSIMDGDDGGEAILSPTSPLALF